MNSNPAPRRIVVAAEKITKNEVDKALAEGKTHVKFKSHKVQRRLLKEQEKIRRKQEIRENQTKALAKAKEAARGARPVGGGIGLAHPHPDMTTDFTTTKGSAHFIDKEGKKIPVPTELVQDITEAFETAVEEEEDLTGAAGPEYRYLQQGEDEWSPMETAPRDGTLIQLRGTWNREIPQDPIVVEGHYMVGGLTEGWETEKGTWFCPDAWKPIQTEEELVMDRAGNVAPEEKREYHNTWIAGEPGADIGEKAIDSIVAEHSLNPFGCEGPSSRVQMFSSHLSSATKVEETQLFQPGLAEQVAETGKQILEQQIIGTAGQMPSNLYGDEANFKPLPEIGGHIQADDSTEK